MKIHKLVPRGFLTVCILKQLKTGSKHGYNIMKCLEKEMGWEPSPGAIYPTLHQLKERGLIAEVKSKDKKKISYKLTKEGRTLSNKIEKEVEEMRNKFCNHIRTMGQIFGIDEPELRGLMKGHEKTRVDNFFLLPVGIRNSLIKSRNLIMKITKNKSKQKKLNKIIKDNFKRLKELEAE